MPDGKQTPAMSDNHVLWPCVYMFQSLITTFAWKKRWDITSHNKLMQKSPSSEADSCQAIQKLSTAMFTPVCHLVLVLSQLKPVPYFLNIQLILSLTSKPSLWSHTAKKQWKQRGTHLTLSRHRKKVPWMMATTMKKLPTFHLRCIPPQHPPAYVNQPKALVTSRD